ncbi:hypothetical protein MRX96_033455 [Rhipicephalus microplus]
MSLRGVGESARMGPKTGQGRRRRRWRKGRMLVRLRGPVVVGTHEGEIVTSSSDYAAQGSANFAIVAAFLGTGLRSGRTRDSSNSDNSATRPSGHVAPRLGDARLGREGWTSGFESESRWSDDDAGRHICEIVPVVGANADPPGLAFLSSERQVSFCGWPEQRPRGSYPNRIAKRGESSLSPGGMSYYLQLRNVLNTMISCYVSRQVTAPQISLSTIDQRTRPLRFQNSEQPVSVSRWLRQSPFHTFPFFFSWKGTLSAAKLHASSLRRRLWQIDGKSMKSRTSPSGSLPQFARFPSCLQAGCCCCGE